MRQADRFGETVGHRGAPVAITAWTSPRSIRSQKMRPCLATVIAPEMVKTTRQDGSRAISIKNVESFTELAAGERRFGHRRRRSRKVVTPSRERLSSGSRPSSRPSWSDRDYPWQPPTRVESGLCRSGHWFYFQCALRLRFQDKARHFPDGNVAQLDFLADEMQNVLRIGSSAGEDVQCDEPQIGIGVAGTVALIENHDCREARGRIVPELIPNLRDHVGAGAFAPRAMAANIAPSSRQTSRETLRQSTRRCLPFPIHKPSQTRRRLHAPPNPTPFGQDDARAKRPQIGTAPILPMDKDRIIYDVISS